MDFSSLTSDHGYSILTSGNSYIDSVPRATSADSPRRFEGVDFVENFDLEGIQLELRSLGLQRYKGLLRGFAAALYLEPGTPTTQALGDVAKRLELAYFLPIPGKLFGPAGRGALRKALSRAALRELEDRLATLDAAYADVRSGDRYSLTYQPGVGTELALNGRALTLIPGADFAQAYFGIWLGEVSIDRNLTRQLLA